MRTEKDFIGERQLPDDALYGIQSLRAHENFPHHSRFFEEWYQAMGVVKHACYLTYLSFSRAVNERGMESRLPSPLIAPEIMEALIQAAIEVSRGEHFEHFIVPALSGGAGTSINMNINEIITNRALLIMAHSIGDYNFIDPILHANVYQSTNDTVPTALKIAVLNLLEQLEEEINFLRAETERLETASRNILRIGRTQMQDAVPSSYGILFSTYSEALSRDWWRVSKCFERIKTVNLGGSAIGTGLGVPRYFIIEAITHLQELTGLPLNRSENMPDATANLDSLAEVHGIIKAHAINLEKIVSDIRLLSSDITNPNDISIPQKQIGSTIMPGKVNPVIPEFVISCAHQVYANDEVITSLTASGCLDLNAYLPIIGHCLLDSLKTLISADKTLKDNLLIDLQFHPEHTAQKLWKSPSITTALSPYIGYYKASQLANEMKNTHSDIFTANQRLHLIDPEKLQDIMRTENLLKLGYSLNEL